MRLLISPVNASPVLSVLDDESGVMGCNEKLKVATPTVIIYGNNTIVSAAMVTFTPHAGKSSGAIQSK